MARRCRERGRSIRVRGGRAAVSAERGGGRAAVGAGRGVKGRRGSDRMRTVYAVQGCPGGGTEGTVRH